MGPRAVHGQGDARPALEVRPGIENGVHRNRAGRPEPESAHQGALQAGAGKELLLLLLSLRSADGGRCAARHRLRVRPIDPDHCRVRQRQQRRSEQPQVDAQQSGDVHRQCATSGQEEGNDQNRRGDGRSDSGARVRFVETAAGYSADAAVAFEQLRNHRSRL